MSLTVSRNKQLHTKGAAEEKGRCPGVLILTSTMRRALESGEEWSCLDGVLHTMEIKQINRGCVREKAVAKS